MIVEYSAEEDESSDDRILLVLVLPFGDGKLITERNDSDIRRSRSITRVEH